jgi:hypothetical protein
MQVTENGTRYQHWKREPANAHSNAFIRYLQRRSDVREVRVKSNEGGTRQILVVYKDTQN